MTTFSAKMQSKVVRLRRKYKDGNDTHHNDILSRILWYSIPVVYPNHMTDGRKAMNSISALHQRRRRYRKYVREMVLSFKGKNVYLVSLTFSDDYYCTTTRESRTQYARKYLNSVCLDYFACLDIGKENGREHYHAVVVTDRPLITVTNGKRGKRFFEFADSKDKWKYGFYSLRPLAIDEKDIYKSLNYALKSSDYAFKSADEKIGIKPFHKRGVTHWLDITDLDSDALPF